MVVAHSSSRLRQRSSSSRSSQRPGSPSRPCGFASCHCHLPTAGLYCVEMPLFRNGRTQSAPSTCCSQCLWCCRLDSLLGPSQPTQACQQPTAAQPSQPDGVPVRAPAAAAATANTAQAAPGNACADVSVAFMIALMRDLLTWASPMQVPHVAPLDRRDRLCHRRRSRFLTSCWDDSVPSLHLYTSAQSVRGLSPPLCNFRPANSKFL